MFLSRPMSYALLAAAGLAFNTAWADIQVSNDLKTTMGALSNETSSSATAINLSILQSKVASLQAQLGAATSQGRIVQLQATITALQSIIARLQDGYTITDYTITTDSATLVNRAIITFSKGNKTLTVVADIPPVITGDDASSSGSDGAGASSGSFDPMDMLTTALQQVGAQMMAQMGANANPLGNIQSTLNNLVTEATNPTPLPNQCQANTNGADTPSPGTAVYDISAGRVYMPDGSVLEAHSGMGAMMDNPSFANQRMSGPTPPNVYNLSLRESPYYGVEALRLMPTDSSAMYGRDGILAHTKLVRGANNGSHGCVAFADYAQFLAAFKSGAVKQLIVVPQKSGGGAAPTCPGEGVRYDVKNPHPEDNKPDTK